MCLQPADHTRSSFWLYFRVTDGSACVSQSLWEAREGWWFAGKYSTAGAIIHLPLRKRGPQNYFNSGTDPFVSIIIICLGLQNRSALPWSCTLISSNGTPIHWNPNLLSFSPEGKLYCRAIKEKWKYLRYHNYRGEGLWWILFLALGLVVLRPAHPRRWFYGSCKVIQWVVSQWQ